MGHFAFAVALREQIGFEKKITVFAFVVDCRSTIPMKENILTSVYVLFCKYSNSWFIY